LQEARRAEWRKQSEVFFSLRCFSKRRNPIAVALRLAKSTLENKRLEEMNHNKAVDDLCPLVNLFENKAMNDSEDQIYLDIEKERFEFEVLRDKHDFQELLNFYFERKMICEDTQREKWTEYYHAHN
jgi:hypothetical protein